MLRTRQTHCTEPGHEFVSIELLDDKGEPYHTTVYLWNEKRQRYEFAFEADIVDTVFDARTTSPIKEHTEEAIRNLHKLQRGNHDGT